jgi:L-ascorbate metabolism protein UlaG (beta-lactamase superfamily)
MIYENKLKPTPYRTPAHTPKPLSWKANQVAFSWLGHSTVLLNLYGTTILTDPVILKRIGPPELWENFFGVRRITKLPLKIEDLPKIDIILISHAHFDHLCRPSLKKLYSLQNKDIHLIVPVHGRKVVRETGFTNIIELDGQGHGNENSISLRNVEIKAFKVEHYSNINYGDRKGIKSANGYMISSGGIRIAYMGDTAYMRHRDDDGVRLSQAELVNWQKQVNPEGAGIDLGIIPIGDSDYKINHIGPADAVKLFGDIKGRKFLPVHYDTFILSSPDEEPHPKTRLLDVLRKQNINDAVLFETPGKKKVFPDIGAEFVLCEQ